MTITARYASTCPTCGQPITPGQAVEWERGAKARHTECPSAGSAPATSSAPQGGASPSASPLATDRQRIALRKMLQRLARVRSFDSRGGSGQGEADRIEAQIGQAGGWDALTRRQASDLLDTVSGMLDDEM